MDDLISRQAAIDEIEERKNANGYRNVAVILEEKTGERYAPFGVWNMIYCNQCWQASGIRSNFCPSCGADMRKEGDTNC